MNDTYNTHSPLNPINQEDNEPLTELEQQQEWNQELLKSKTQLLKDLRALKAIESNITTFGFLTHEETIEKYRILNKY